MMRFFVLVFVVAVPVIAEPGQVCFDSNQCDERECCVMSMQAYSVPGCQSLVSLNDNCRPNNTPIDGQYQYPNGDTVNVTNVYVAVCPCDVGLTCDREGHCVSQFP